MTAVYGHGLGNDIELDLNNISAAESDEEDRQDQIKELLAGALSNETFYDEDDSDVSFIQSQSNIFKDNVQEEGENNISVHSLNSNTAPHRINGSFNRHDYNSPEGDGEDMRDFQRRVADSRPFGAQAERGTEEIEAKNATVSLMHKQHCPQQIGSGDHDMGEDNQMWLGNSAENKLDQLKTMCEFRERQINRCEETISTLTKEKRVLNHQVGLMKSEMIQMKGVQDDMEKELKLKDDEIAYLKSKIQEAIDEFQILKQTETSLKDQNNRLSSEVSRLEQEVKLTGTIGASVQQAEVNEVIRHIREKHAREIASWKAIVAELEGRIQVEKRSDLIFHANSTDPGINTSTQTEQPSFLVSRTMQTESSSSFAISKAIQAECSKFCISKATQAECSNFSASKATQAGSCNLPVSAATQAECSNPSASKATQAESCNLSSKSTQSERVERNENASIQSDYRRSSVPTNVSSVQTEETMKTYDVLAELIQQWSGEVSESERRAQVAESQARFTEDSLKKLSKRYKEVSRTVAICRKEWKAQEQLLKKKHAETKAHYVNLLLNLGQKLESLEDVDNSN